jgi:hypothetical protein
MAHYVRLLRRFAAVQSFRSSEFQEFIVSEVQSFRSSGVDQGMAESQSDLTLLSKALENLNFTALSSTIFVVSPAEDEGLPTLRHHS